nr:immunoglobulin heavy chain junction region [Mus musculus]
CARKSGDGYHWYFDVW